MSTDRGEELADADRLKAFTDGVVAIAMTLLILPLMDSVGGASRDKLSSAEWIAANITQLFSFALSFVLIAVFWFEHHRLFARVRFASGQLVILSVVWMATIVWLPVATAIVGQLPDDPVQKALYIGSLFLTNAVMTLLGWYLLRHPALHDIPAQRLHRGILADAVASALFLVALAIAILIPVVDYWALTLLLLTGPIQGLVVKRRVSGGTAPR